MVAGARYLSDWRKEEPVLAAHWQYRGGEHEEREMARVGRVT